MIKNLYRLNWSKLRHDFWVSRQIENRTYFMVGSIPIAYQDFHTCNYVISDYWLTAHTSAKMGLSKWVMLSGTEIKEMITLGQYKLIEHQKFIDDLIDLTDKKRMLNASAKAAVVTDTKSQTKEVR